VQGAMIQMLSHGFVSAALFLVVGVVYDRLHTRDIARYGGLVERMPNYAFVFMVFMLASVGLPGTSGFVGEFLILLGAFRWDPRLAAFAATGAILSATYMLWMFQRVNYGTVTNEKNAALPDLDRREWTVLVPIIASAILMGVLPNLFLRPIGPSVDRLLNQMHVAVPERAQGDGNRDLGFGIRDARVVIRDASRANPNPKSQTANPAEASR
jgi:NADH-quinone oxidoreductase subunit M